MFEKYGTPQLFGTWSVNLASPGFSGTLPQQTDASEDIPLFCQVYNREWHRVWTYIHTKWANKVVGGVKEFVWVTEYQERGAPHVHFVLWTGKSLEQLIEQNESDDKSQIVISCSRTPEGNHLRNLVQTHQVHNHVPSYCERTRLDGTTFCRFSFPKPLAETTHIDHDSDHVVYKRLDGDEDVNGYNPDILRFVQSNMDLQFNVGTRALRYICKYITKPTEIYKGTISTPEPEQEEPTGQRGKRKRGNVVRVVGLVGLLRI